MTESNNTAYTTISVLQNSPNGLAAFNITAYDGAGNQFNVTQNDASANVIIDTANPTAKSNHIQRQRSQRITCNLGQYSKHHNYSKRRYSLDANYNPWCSTYVMSTKRSIVANASVM